jgi:hydrogenase maturation protease
LNESTSGAPLTGGVQAKRPPCLVLGMGNLLLEDEGLGVHALSILLQRFELSEAVECLDGGTSGMALTDDIGGREHLLVLDAVQTGDPPGTLVSLRGGEVPVYFGVKVTPHQLGLSDVLAHLELTGERPGSVTVLGLVPASMEMSLQPSATIAAELDGLVNAAVEELTALGYPPRPKAGPGA